MATTKYEKYDSMDREQDKLDEEKYRFIPYEESESHKNYQAMQSTISAEQKEEWDKELEVERYKNYND